MKHRKKVKKMGRTKDHREATLRNMFSTLLMNESIVTTESKAKILRPYAEKMISRAKKMDINSKRKMKSLLSTGKVYRKLFETIVPQYKDREGGYVRIIKIGVPKRGDGSPQSIVELV